MGYTAGMIDCNMSFSKWQKLIAARILNAVPAAFSGVEAPVLAKLELVDTYFKCNCCEVGRTSWSGCFRRAAS